MNRRNWVVEISMNDADPATYGPYSQRRARELCEQVERGLARAERDDIIAVLPFPIQPFNVTEILKDFGV